MTRRYIYDFLKCRDSVVRDCVSFHGGFFPKECFNDGFVMHYGERVSIEEFSKVAKHFKRTK